MLQRSSGVVKKMTSGTLYDQGDILLVPFPFTDLSNTKQRPVLVLSKKGYNQKNDDIVTCGITSNLSEKNFVVMITSEDLISGSLPKTSNIRVDKLFTLEKSIVKRRLGRVSQDTLQHVKELFFQIM